MKARQQGLQQQRKVEEATAEEAQIRAKAKMGQKGFRWHALPPQVCAGGGVLRLWLLWFT